MSDETNQGPDIRERRLAAIMFTDVTGYSARMQVDESGTLKLVGEDMAQMKAICVSHGGEVLTTMGDGMLVCFSSTVRAVACALEIQTNFGKRRESLPPELNLDHRIGIHLGDIFVRDGNVAGDGVNIAARLQTKAPAGGICISQTVHDTIKGKLAMQSVFIGPQSFKNIQEPISIYHLAPEGVKTASPFGVASVPKQAGSSGIFSRNAAGQRRLSPLAWAAAAVMIVAVVIAGRRYGPAVSPAPAAEKPVVLPASPEPAKPLAPVPVSVPAVSEPPKPKPADPRVTDLVARARSLIEVIGAKKEDFTSAEQLLHEAVTLDPASAAAWAATSELDERMFHSGIDRSRQRMESASAHAQTAVSLGPDYLPAMIALGNAQRMRPAESEAAEATFRRAAGIAPDNPEVLRLLGETLKAGGKFEESLGSFQKAAAMPGAPRILQTEEAESLFALRRLDEASVLAKKSADLPTPVNQCLLARLALSWHGDVNQAIRELSRIQKPRRTDQEVVLVTAYAYLVARRPNDALATLASYPFPFFYDQDFIGPKAYLAGLARRELKQEDKAKADWDAAMDVVREHLAATPQNSGLQLMQDVLLAQMGRGSAALPNARAKLQAAGRIQPPDLWMMDAAVVFCVAGRKQEAIDRIETLLSKPASWPLTAALLRIDPVWDPLRDDPRFQKLAQADEPAK